MLIGLVKHQRSKNSSEIIFPLLSLNIMEHHTHKIGLNFQIGQSLFFHFFRGMKIRSFGPDALYAVFVATVLLICGGATPIRGYNLSVGVGLRHLVTMRPISFRVTFTFLECPDLLQ